MPADAFEERTDVTAGAAACSLIGSAIERDFRSGLTKPFVEEDGKERFDRDISGFPFRENEDRNREQMYRHPLRIGPARHWRSFSIFKNRDRAWLLEKSPP